MATDIERLIVTLEARMRTYERELDKARGNTNKNLKNIEDRFGKTEGVIANFGKGLVGGVLSAVSFAAIIQGAIAATAAIDNLGRSARTLGLDTTFFQALEFAGIEQGVKGLDEALKHFAEGAGEAAAGYGDFYDFLKKSNPALAESIRLASDQEQRIRLVADAIQQESSAQRRAALARAAFGDAGTEMVRILERGSAGLDEFTRRASDMGLILERDLIKRAEELNRQFDLAKKVIGVEFQRTLVEIMPLIVEFAKIVGATATGVSRLVDVFRGLENRATHSLESQLGLLKDALKASEEGASTNPWFDKSIVLKEISDIEAELDRRRTKITITPPPPKPQSGQGGDTDPFERAIEQAEKRIAVLNADTLAADLNTAARQRARVVAELQTAAIKANKDAGLENTAVTADQAAKIELVAAAYEKAAAASERANAPIRSFAREARDLGKQLEEATVSALHGLEDAFVDIIAGTGNVKEAFSKMAAGIAQDLARIAVRQAITGPLAAALGSLGGPGGFRIPGFAGGTNFAPGGLAVVGERGPELVNLPRGAQVVPNDVARKMGGGGSSVVIQQRNTFNGADPASEARLMMAIQISGRQAVNEAVRQVSTTRRNNPGFLRT